MKMTRSDEDVIHDYLEVYPLKHSRGQDFRHEHCWHILQVRGPCNWVCGFVEVAKTLQRFGENSRTTQEEEVLWCFSCTQWFGYEEWGLQMREAKTLCNSLAKPGFASSSGTKSTHGVKQAKNVLHNGKTWE